MTAPCDEPFEDIDYLAGEDVGAKFEGDDQEDEGLYRGQQ